MYLYNLSVNKCMSVIEKQPFPRHKLYLHLHAEMTFQDENSLQPHLKQISRDNSQSIKIISRSMIDASELAKIGACICLKYWASTGTTDLFLFSQFFFVLSCPASSKVSFGEWLLTDKLWQQKCYSIVILRLFFFPP